MKNKLLVTSALVGLVASGSAFAETKIGGGLKLSYSATSEKASTDSVSGFGRETQIDFSKKGDLSNGLKFAAGFSLEFDGNETSATSASNENVYFDVSSGNTTVMFGIDHGASLSQTATPRVAENAASTLGAGPTIAYDYSPGQLYDVFAVKVGQSTPVGSFTVSYAPNLNDSGSAGDTGAATPSGNTRSAYDVVYKGNAGIDGLSLVAGYHKADAVENKDYQDGKVLQYGVGYNFGRFSAGVTRSDEDETVNGTERESTEYGITAAVTNNISVGALYITTDGKEAGTDFAQKEEIMVGTIAYNMGPATLSFSYATVENILGSVTANDTDVGTLRVTTAF